MLFKFCVCSFLFVSNLHDKKEYDNNFVISQEANMLTTLKKIEIIYSLVFFFFFFVFFFFFFFLFFFFFSFILVS